MMIGTELSERRRLQTSSPSSLREHQIEHDEIDVLLREPRQSLLAVQRVHDPEPVALERIREQLLHGVLVVDEQDGRGVGHG